MRRSHVAIAFAALLLLALTRKPEARAGQAAVSHSLPGQEDLTFWINHNGLEQIDFEGEAGFGDLARVLMRRRAFAPKLNALRDRFVFRSPEIRTLDTPEFLGQTSFIVGKGRIFNLPVVTGGKAYLHRVREPEEGTHKRTIHGREYTFDVRPVHRLTVKILDESGKPSPARVYLTGADGLAYAPKGSVNRYAAEPAEPFFYSNGEPFAIDLPAGETRVEATRGTEYELVAQTVRLNQPTEITLRLKRWVNLPSRGWYSADAHIHANYTAPHHQDITADDVRLYALAEDLHIPNMVVANSSGDVVHDRKFFEGKPSALVPSPYFLYWNEEMRNAGLYGHMCFFNLKSLVEPLYTGFRGSQQPYDYPSNYVQAKAARVQGGAVTYAHPGYGANFEQASMREMPVDLALGEIDAMDVLSNNPEDVALELWYRLLNCGLRLGISAGTDSFTNVADHYVPGGGRVYAHVEGRMNYAAWIRAFKAGRTFASNGPMLLLKVNGKEPGSELRLGAGDQKLRVEVEMKSAIPVDRVELIVNGKAQPPATTLTLDRSSWIAARVRGPGHRMVLNDDRAFAHTSPVYVYLGDQPIRSQQDAAFWIDWIDKLIARTSQRGQFANEAQKAETIALFRKAQEIYRR